MSRLGRTGESCASVLSHRESVCLNSAWVRRLGLVGWAAAAAAAPSPPEAIAIEPKRSVCPHTGAAQPMPSFHTAAL
jgi:hypothetical protein